MFIHNRVYVDLIVYLSRKIVSGRRLNWGFLVGTLISKILIITGIWLLISCNAPRNNPLDPQNPNSPYSTLEGQIQTFSVPRQSLVGVQVHWKNENVQVVSDGSGKFTIREILPQDGWVVFSKTGFHADSAHVQWGALKKLSLDRFLNAVPVLNRLDVYSVVTNRHGSPQKFEAVLFAEIQDADGDIDSVFWQIPELEQDGFLRFDPGDNAYKTAFETILLPNEELVGYNFQIFVEDLFEKRILIGQQPIRRVIKQEAIALSPLGGVIVSPTPQLRWLRFTPGFTHSYRLEVFEIIDFADPRLAWEKEPVPSDSISFTVDSALPAGEYFWVIWAIDEFKNRTRSKPVTFNVQ